MPRPSLPSEQSVGCSCDPRLSAPVVNYNPWSLIRIDACLACGRVECIEPVGDEPRGAGPARGCNFVYALPAEYAAWVAGWPRMVADSPRRPFWVPADLRLATWQEFEQARSAAGSQAAMPPAQRLLQFAIPKAPPPALPKDLANHLRFWGLLWQAASTPEELSKFLWTSCYCE